MSHKTAMQVLLDACESGEVICRDPDSTPLDEATFRRLAGCDDNGNHIGGDIWLTWNVEIDCPRLSTAHTILELWTITTVADLRVWYLKTTGKELPGLLTGKERE